MGEHVTRVMEAPVTPKRASGSPTRDSTRAESPKSGDSARPEHKHSPKRELELLAGTASLSERKQQLFKRDEVRAVYNERASTLNATLVPFREVRRS